jgi:drug/metabolite transporter (DMT)-like permease
MYIAFSFGIKGLFIGGIARVSQVQLIQPFCTLIVASLFLGRRVDEYKYHICYTRSINGNDW